MDDFARVVRKPDLVASVKQQRSRKVSGTEKVRVQR